MELVEEEARLRVSAGFLQQVFAKLFSSRIFFLNFSSNRFFLEKLLVCLIPFCLFQVELEEREGKTDGTVAIQRMQEELVSRHCLLRFCTKRDRPQRWSIFRAMRCRWFIFQQRCDSDYFWKSLTSPSSRLFPLTIGNHYFSIILLILRPIILRLFTICHPFQ